MILIAGVIITVGLGFNWLVREQIKASDGLKKKAEAILQARSAYERLIYLLLNGRLSPKALLISGGVLTELKAIPLNGQEIQLGSDVFVRVQDSNGLLSLSSFDLNALRRLIDKVGQVQSVDAAVESFRDWIDPDDLTGVNGAEEAYYLNQKLPYKPRNYLIQYPEEAALIRGVGKGVYEKIEPYVTILPVTGFNPNTSSDVVLKTYLNIGEETLVALKSYLSKYSLTSDAPLFHLTGRSLVFTGNENHYFPSRFMEVSLRVGSPRSLCTIKAGLSLVSSPQAPYSVVYWREE